MVQAQAVGCPDLIRMDRGAVALQMNDLGPRVVLGRHEQEIARPPNRHRDCDSISGLEWDLPLQVAVVRIHRDHRAVHHDHQLFPAVDLDEQGRGVGIVEIILRPGHAAVLLLEGHHRMASPSDGDDHGFPKGNRARGVTVHGSRAMVILQELLGPEDLAGLLVDRLETAGHARGEQPVADDQRRGVWPVTLVGGSVAAKTHGSVVLPKGLAGGGVAGQHDLFLLPAIHRVQNVILHGGRGVAFAQRPFPNDFGPRRGPRIFQPRGFGLKITMGAAPLRPGNAGRGFCALSQRRRRGCDLQKGSPLHSPIRRPSPGNVPAHVCGELAGGGTLSSWWDAAGLPYGPSLVACRLSPRIGRSGAARIATASPPKPACSNRGLPEARDWYGKLKASGKATPRSPLRAIGSIRKANRATRSLSSPSIPTPASNCGRSPTAARTMSRAAMALEEPPPPMATGCMRWPPMARWPVFGLQPVSAFGE